MGSFINFSAPLFVLSMIKPYIYYFILSGYALRDLKKNNDRFEWVKKHFVNCEAIKPYLVDAKIMRKNWTLIKDAFISNFFKSPFQ
ncbi:MAG: hypothetical protein ACI9J3_002850 [Parvicellaceae bacterium]|jgi:hypothetical protein